MADQEEHIRMSTWGIRKRIKNWLLFRLITTLISFLNFLPRKAAISLGGFLGRMAYLIIWDARRRTLSNLSLAFGEKTNEKELTRLACKVFQNLGKNVADAVRLKKMTWEDVEKITEIEGFEHLDRAYQAGKGAIALSGHIGNFELLGAYLSLRGYKVSVVGRELYDPRLDRLLVKNRESLSLENIPSRAGIRPVIRALRAGRVLGVLADQDSSRVRGVFVDFFGRPTRTPAGPGLLSYKIRSPIIPMAIVRKSRDRYRIIVKPEVELGFSGDREKDLIDVTQKYTRVLESIIREYPDQWLWMHDRWKSKPE